MHSATARSCTSIARPHSRDRTAGTLKLQALRHLCCIFAGVLPGVPAARRGRTSRGGVDARCTSWISTGCECKLKSFNHFSTLAISALMSELLHRTDPVCSILSRSGRLGNWLLLFFAAVGRSPNGRCEFCRQGIWFCLSKVSWGSLIGWVFPMSHRL